MGLKYSNNYGFYISESSAELIKILEFNENVNKEEDEDE